MFEYNYRSTGVFEPVFHSHTFYEVYYFHEGKCNYLIGDQIYNLAPGDLILMYGMTLHCPKIDPSVPYIRSIIHFDPSILRPYTDLPQAVPILQPFEQFRNYRLILSAEDREELERILVLMHGYQQRGDHVGEGRLMLAFLDLLHFIYDRCRQPLREQREFPSDKEKAVQDVIALLETRYTEEELSMERLQQELHLSKSYLAKIFKEVTGVTIFEYVYRKRINEARILFLLHPGLAVTDASFRLGFKHLAHFSRLFKEHVGVSPERYKKQLKDEQAAMKRSGKH
ncbi:AraC family transcriptional regulator [Cohnella cholangitidis]|uniref:AraC family transcriptional regulator n=1 Tax=Cohnella cholangitidis TaxID=2598458 RepID=A0A7G5C4J4_9BACL|nr:AraC family transcriptional regulator [Cohnella cholangitidis]QMV44128.1 AraC family transcriptional regulator [Cohnella cholangitidis]